MDKSKLALYLTAEKYRLGKGYTRAIRLYQEILAIDEDDLGVLKKLALCHEKNNEPEKAIPVYYQMANIHEKGKDVDNALAALEKAREISPDKEETLNRIEQLQQKKEALVAETEASVSDDVIAMDDGKKIQELQTPPVRFETPLFKDLNEEQWDSIIELIIPLQMPAGTIVFHEGDSSSSLYIVREGSFEVSTSVSETSDSPEEAVFSVLGPGQFFGEFAFLTGKPRVATVKAQEDSVVYQLTKEALDSLVSKYKEIEDRLFLFYKSRALDLVLAKSKLFSAIPATERREMLEWFVMQKFKAGDTVVAEGQKGDDIYLIKKGEVRVETSSPEGDQIVLSILGQHQFFGEVSFLSGRPRTANVIASTDCEILTIGREDLEKIIVKYPQIEKILRNYQARRAQSTLEKLTEMM